MKTNLTLVLQALIKRKMRILAPCAMLLLLCNTRFTYNADTVVEPSMVTSVLPAQTPETTQKTTDSAQVVAHVDKKFDPAGAPKATKTPHKKTKRDPNKTITFRYNNENLIDVINYLAAQKEINILLPQGADAITNKVTISIDEKISLAQAWEMLDVILGIAGYSMLPKGDMYVIKKNTDTISRELTKLYVGTKPEDLPNTEEQIQYLYFLSNAKVTDDGDLSQLLSNLMPKGSYKVDSSTNGIIFSTKANLIRSIMRIVAELDKPGFAEKLAVIHLRHASAELIAKLFTDNIIKANDNFDRYRFDAKKQSDASYFSKNVKIIPETRTNSLIVLGKAQAVERIQDFIYKYIDVELESGKSILHIYQLQYLEADKAKEALDKVIDSAKAADGTGQAKGSPINQTGTQRTFGTVIIQTDAAMLSQGTAPAGGTDGAGSEAAFGGNKLIIAARNDDWIVIKELLEKLDQPQPQVLIEIIIADLTLDDFKNLGASLRNPLKIPLPNDVQFQSGMAPNGQGLILDPTQNNPKTINADLLNPDLPAATGADPVSQAYFADEGSSVFSFNDNNGRTWCVAEILKSVNKSKILSAPHVLATNNQEALVKIGESRNLADESVGTAGSTTIKRKWVDAFLKVTLKPRISSEAQSVTMQISIDITQYNSNKASDRTTRTIITNATVHDKDVLAIGGLLRTDSIDTIRKTPILGDIPLLGWFFKGHNTKVEKANLTVFIQPIIIHPYLRGGVSPETQKYVKLMKASAQEGDLFDSVKDPITRVFFKSGTQNAETEIEKFVEKNQAKKLEPLIMAQNMVPPAQQPQEPTLNKQPQVVTLASTLMPIKDITGTEAKAANAPQQTSAQTTTQAQKNSSTQAAAPAQQTMVTQHLAQAIPEKAPEHIDKIKELVKNEENPLRRVHG